MAVANDPVVAAPDRLPAPPAAAAAEVVEVMRLVDAVIPAAAADQTRPAWHFRPPALWMNDICGAIHHDGWYHVFYQFNPRSPLPSWHPDQTSAWGHARSRDLVAWEHLPIAIAAVAGEGELRCNSGCVVLDDEETPTIFSTYYREHPLVDTSWAFSCDLSPLPLGEAGRRPGEGASDDATEAPSPQPSPGGRGRW